MLPRRRSVRITLGIATYLLFAFTVITSTLYRDDEDTLENYAAMVHSGALGNMAGLQFAEAEKKYRLAAELLRAHAGAREAEQRSNYAEALEGRGDALKAQGRYPEAAKHYARAIEIYQVSEGPLATALMAPLWSLEQIHRAMGRDSLADLCDARIDSIAAFHARIVEKEVERLRAGKGGDGRALAERLMWLGNLYSAEGALARAELAYLEAHEIRRRAFGPKYYETVWAQQRRGTVAAYMGRTTVATAALDSALALNEGSFGRNSPYLAEEMSLRGAVAIKQGKVEEARALYGRVLAALESVIGRDQNHALPTMAKVAECDAALGRFAEAKAMWKRVHRVHRRLHGEASYPAGLDLLEIAEIEERAGNAPLARETCGRALRVLLQAVGPRHPAVTEARYYLSELDRSVEEADAAADGDADALPDSQRPAPVGRPAGPASPAGPAPPANQKRPPAGDTPTDDPADFTAA